MTFASRHPCAATRGWFAAVSAAAFVWSLGLASQHPLWPGLVLATSCAWVVTSALRPGLWLLVVPAALPLASLAPWTGWLIFDEFDILIAGAVAGGYARMALRPRPSATCGTQAAVLVFGGLGLIGAWRGLSDAGSVTTGLFEGYSGAMNSIRIVKPLLYALLVWPLLRRRCRDAASSAWAVERLSLGMLLGLCSVLVALLRERAAYPGLLDFSSPYRTVAWFWEMHVGGAAIDAYLALTAPFVAWALWSARSMRWWSAAAALALLTEYACLTTFSRGTYLAVFGPLTVLSVFLHRRRRNERDAGRAFQPGRVCNAALLIAMAVQAFLVVGSESFMLGRIGDSGHDLRSRLVHWQHGLDLLTTPTDWLLGIGLGRLPSRYAANAPGGEFPGAAVLQAAQPDPFVRLDGPRSLPVLGGMYGLTQRVPLESNSPLTARFDVRASRAIRLRLSVCEMHLLYERRCQDAQMHIEPGADSWRAAAVGLEGPALSEGGWFAHRTGVFTVSVLDADASVELDNLSLKGADGVERLRNGHFTRQLSAWFPAAKNQFLPWHIDNLYLELVIERGVPGLLAFLLLMGFVAWRLAFGAARRFSVSPFLLTSLAGAMTVGLVSSIMDVPRVAFGLFLVTLASLALKPD